jgi:hypothetical protein
MKSSKKKKALTKDVSISYKKETAQERYALELPNSPV